MSIEAMKLALEALEFNDRRFEIDNYPDNGATRGVGQKAITSLCQAIEQAQKRPAPMSEPNRIVAYSAAEKLRSLGYQWDEKAAAWQAQKQEPVAMVMPVATVISETGDESVTMSWWHEPALPVGTKLYTSPPQRQPLTDEHLLLILSKIDEYAVRLPRGLREFARAIEAVHGIKGES